MASSPPQLSLEAEKQIRRYMISLVTLPAVVLTLLAFVAGFFVNDVARSDAQKEAFNKLMLPMMEASAATGKAQSQAQAAQKRATKAAAEIVKLEKVVRGAVSKASAAQKQASVAEKEATIALGQARRQLQIVGKLVAQLQRQTQELDKKLADLQEVRDKILRSKVFRISESNINSITEKLVKNTTFVKEIGIKISKDRRNIEKKIEEVNKKSIRRDYILKKWLGRIYLRAIQYTSNWPQQISQEGRGAIGELDQIPDK